MKEFDIINQYFSHSIHHRSLIDLGVGDDAALISTPPGAQLVCSIDTLVEGIHFLKNTPAADLGYKSLAVSLSDMAAMGAKPFATLLSIALPTSNSEWLEQFAEGFFEIANEFDTDLIGGDTTRGPLTISTVVHGLVPKGKSLFRSGAKAGDLIYVTGFLGDAGLALQLQQQQNQQPIDPTLLARLNRPSPRVKEGIALRELASSAIDISDGLIADLKKILQASQVGATLYTQQLPISSHINKHCSSRQAWTYALTSGDDFELCFTIPEAKQQALTKLFANLDCNIQCIGKVQPNLDVIILDENGNLFNTKTDGYEHFSN